MKRILSVILCIFLLTGCSGTDQHMQKALNLRESLSKCKQTTFTANISADYGEKLYSFSLSCSTDNDGNMSFEVLSPETISGIKGSVASSGGKLTFDDTVLAFPLLAEGELSPVSSPWLLIKTLLGGYISSCGMDGDRLRITMDDSYEEDALQLDIWLDNADLPVGCEITWQGRRILSMTLENFKIL